MNDNNRQFERLSFWQLLAKTSVEIPIIQRDYAQGRENQQKVRGKFLKTLYDALTEKPVELDFVYGSEENNTLQPLDGQQRLTTLFLLHWYIATKENRIDEFQKRLEIRNGKNEITKQKFSYENRTSSREFCNELTTNRIDFDNLLTADTDKDQSKDNELSKTIINSAWFVASWEKDPTISAMLTMLDAVHAKFKDTPELWEKLIVEYNPSITFLYVKLENFGLSDDLYIKMNARGKQLTSFENFKSQIEKYIEINKFEENITNSEEKFAHRIDTIWTDLFWQYKEKQEDNSYFIDAKLINFIAGIAINCYAEKSYIAEDKEEKERIEQRIQQLANISTEVTHEDFGTKKAFQYLIRCFDIYAEKDNIKPFKTKLWGTDEDDFLFKDIISDKPTQQKRVLFYAQTEYLLNHENFNQDEFDNWIRVIRNIVENAISGNWNTELMINLIQLVHKWASNSNDIYSFLSKENPNDYTVAKEQIKEEIRKAKIITNPDYKNIICEIEDTDFCKGTINWCLECITNSDNIFELQKLIKIKEIIDSYLNENTISNDFRRAILTVGDFYYHVSWGGNIEMHKYCLVLDRSDLKQKYTKSNRFESFFKPLILQLMDKPLFSIIESYICPEDMPNWKKRLITESNLLDKHCQGHYFGITDDKQACYLFKLKKRPANREECKKVK